MKSKPVLAQTHRHGLSSTVSLKREEYVTVGAANQQYQQQYHKHQHDILMCTTQLGQGYACILYTSIEQNFGNFFTQRSLFRLEAKSDIAETWLRRQITQKYD